MKTIAHTFQRCIRLLAFSLYGTPWGLITMTLAIPVSHLVNRFTFGQARIPGSFGELLLQISKIKVLTWQFSSDSAPFTLQLCVIGLYGGAIVGFLVFFYKGLTTNLDWSSIPRVHHLISAGSFLAACLFGILNCLR